jgi:uncharacterized repeat protein (TIGR03803 family)
LICAALTRATNSSTVILSEAKNPLQEGTSGAITGSSATKLLHCIALLETGLVFDAAGNLYGATMSGGVHQGLNGKGTIFELSPQPDGTWTESMLFSLNGSDGEGPQWGGLTIDASGNLYGGAKTGGANGDGAIFRITP